MHLAGQIEERLGPDAEIRILQQARPPARRSRDRRPTRRIESARRRMSPSGCDSSSRSDGSQVLVCCASSSAKRVSHLARHRRPRASGASASAADRSMVVGRGALGIEAMPVNAVVDGPDVFRAQPPRDQHPDTQEHEVDRGGAAKAETEARHEHEALGRETQQECAAAVRDPVHDDVDRVLERALAVRAQSAGRAARSVALSTENRKP